MRINGENLPTIEVFQNMITVADSWVARSNKLGSGNGEAKLYMSSKDDMYAFFGRESFTARCFMLKTDLISYMNAIKNEYLAPTQNYAQKDSFPALWAERMDKVKDLNDVIFFNVSDQHQIAGPRGYVNSNEDVYRLIRELALPLVSYIYVEKVGLESDPLFYWKLFVDFETIWEQKNGPLVFHYGKAASSAVQTTPLTSEDEKAVAEIKKARDGQGKYREQLLEQCPYCPFTMIADERLLIASHIKPWAVCEPKEQVDPYNGYTLSPLYDKLFDRGFITFKENRHVVLSDFISPLTWKRIGLKNDTFIQALPMDDRRIKYLEFHQQSVFKGFFEK